MPYKVFRLGRIAGELVGSPENCLRPLSNKNGIFSNENYSLKNYKKIFVIFFFLIKNNLWKKLIFQSCVHKNNFH